LLKLPKQDSKKIGEDIGKGLIAGIKRSVNAKAIGGTLKEGFKEKSFALFHRIDEN
jgi:hypothetical protein